LKNFFFYYTATTEIYTLSESGQQWWRDAIDHEAVLADASERATASRTASAATA
jgi:hypothetical protein